MFMPMVIKPETENRLRGYPEALNEALCAALESDPRVFVLGQGVDDAHASFGITRNLVERFGAARVFDTPLSEEAMTGVCVGAALTGMRPVYFHNRPDFLLLAFNQLVNHAAKIHYLDNGQSKVPMVVWSAIGRGWGAGAQHSQAIQGMLLGVPGLKIVMPSTPYDAKGLLLSAIADDNPVLIFEHRWCLRQKGNVPAEPYLIPLGKGVYRRRGTELTIVGLSYAAELSTAVADQLSNEGLTAEVIDLRCLKPLDEAILLESLRKTGRLLVVDTGWAMGGACAEIGCLAVEKAFSFLKAPVRRIGLPDVSCPAGYAQELEYYPSTEKIAAVARELCGKGN